jgi:hypothetical protein
LTFLAHLAIGNVTFAITWRPPSIICSLLIVHILIFSSEAAFTNMAATEIIVSDWLISKKIFSSETA